MWIFPQSKNHQNFLNDNIHEQDARGHIGHLSNIGHTSNQILHM